MDASALPKANVADTLPLRLAGCDVIVVSGSLPVLPDALLRQLKIGGRLIAVVGEAPVMEMQLVTRTEEDAFNTVVVLETLVAPLENTARRDKFVF